MLASLRPLFFSCLFFSCFIYSSALGITQTSSSSELAHLTKTGFTVVKFYTLTCPSCRPATKIFHDSAKKHEPNYTFVEANVNENMKLLKEYNFEHVPTFIFFKNGSEVKRLGMVQIPWEFERTLEEAFKNSK